MKIIKKEILAVYILNALSLFLPILSFFFLFMFVNILPGTTDDKEGFGFLIAMLMIPIIGFSGVLLIISAIMNLVLKDMYLYVLIFIVISYYSLINFFIDSNNNFYLWAIIFCILAYLYCFFIFCRRDKKLWINAD